MPAQALERRRVVAELEAGERGQVEVSVVVVLAVPGERPLALRLGDRVGAQVEAGVEKAGQLDLLLARAAHGIATARPTTEPSRSLP